MSDSIFQKLEIEAFRAGLTPRTRESLEWFRDRLKDMKTINRNNLLKDPALQKRQRVGVGRMYMYFYDPKHRKTLPYYDSFPLTIVMQPTSDGFYGLNLHYIHPTVRARLFDKLLETSNNSRYDETTKFKLNYSILQNVSSLKAFRPCFKRYLTTQIDSPIVMVESPEWEIATFLPTHQFNKASARKVWAESRRAAK